MKKVTSAGEVVFFAKIRLWVSKSGWFLHQHVLVWFFFLLLFCCFFVLFCFGLFFKLLRNSSLF